MRVCVAYVRVCVQSDRHLMRVYTVGVSECLAVIDVCYILCSVGSGRRPNGVLQVGSWAKT